MLSTLIKPYYEISKSIDLLSTKLVRLVNKKSVATIVLLDGATWYYNELLKRGVVFNKVIFLKVSSYEGISSSGKVSISNFNKREFDKISEIVVIDDILDTGLTFLSVKKFIKEQLGITKVKLSTLLRKEIPSNFKIKIVGSPISIPSGMFVVGCGLDYEGQFRNVSDLYQLHPLINLSKGMNYYSVVVTDGFVTVRKYLYHNTTDNKRRITARNCYPCSEEGLLEAKAAAKKLSDKLFSHE